MHDPEGVIPTDPQQPSHRTQPGVPRGPLPARPQPRMEQEGLLDRLGGQPAPTRGLLFPLASVSSLPEPPVSGAGCFPANLRTGWQGGDAFPEEGDGGRGPGLRGAGPPTWSQAAWPLTAGLSPLGRRRPMGEPRACAQAEMDHPSSPTVPLGSPRSSAHPPALRVDQGREAGLMPIPGPDTPWSSHCGKPGWEQWGIPKG